jgi:hypothetical protein
VSYQASIKTIHRQSVDVKFLAPSNSLGVFLNIPSGSSGKGEKKKKRIGSNQQISFQQRFLPYKPVHPFLGRNRL